MPSLPSTTQARQEMFLSIFAKKGTLRSAVREMREIEKAKGLSRELSHDTVKVWKREDVYGFRDKLQAAEAEFADYLEDMALTYVEGLKPGQNPVMLLAMLNAAKPEKYRPKVVVHDDTSVMGLVSELRSLGARTRKALPNPEATEEDNGQVEDAPRSIEDDIRAVIIKRSRRITVE